jgi:iron complex outermembrane receptor protein
MHGSATSYAGLAHADFKVNDKFNIIAGIRYSIEHKTGSFGYAYQRGIPNDVFTVLGVFPAPAYDASHTDRAVSGTFGLQYHPTRDVMLYATYNRGKAGGVNIDQNGAGTLLNNATAVAALPAAVRYLVSLANPGKTVSAPLDPTYRPEEVNAFEVGAKTQYFNHRARTNIAFYYYDISDLQIGQFVGLRFTVLNAKSAKDYGLEIENAFQVNKALTLNADATWIMKASYAVDPNIDAVLSGSRFRYAPKLTLNLAANVDTPLTDKLDLVGRVQYQYTSSQFINTAGSNVQGRSVWSTPISG